MCPPPGLQRDLSTIARSYEIRASATTGTIWDLRVADGTPLTLMNSVFSILFAWCVVSDHP
jgi:hypothetical protein